MCLSDRPSLGKVNYSNSIVFVRNDQKSRDIHVRVNEEWSVAPIILKKCLSSGRDVFGNAAYEDEHHLFN